MKRGLTSNDHLLLKADGVRAHADSFFVSARANGLDDMRYSFTISKKHGNAVKRNKLRRRLTAALQDALKTLDAQVSLDLVIVLKKDTILDQTYTDLVKDVTKAVKNVHEKARSKSR